LDELQRRWTAGRGGDGGTAAAAGGTNSAAAGVSQGAAALFRELAAAAEEAVPVDGTAAASAPAPASKHPEGRLQETVELLAGCHKSVLAKLAGLKGRPRCVALYRKCGANLAVDTSDSCVCKIHKA